MRVYIKPDMEGITGIIHEPEQTSRTGMYYDGARKLMTGDINAVARGAVKGGATEVFVESGHASWGSNILFEDLDSSITYLDGRTASRPISVMKEFYKKSDAFFLVGQHPMRGTHRGVIEHTFLPPINELRVNDILMGEAGVKASIAGFFNVPVAFISGCDQTVKEAKELFGEIEGVAVKKGLGRTAAALITPEKTRKMLEDGAERAMNNLSRYKPYKISEPTTIRVEFQHTGMADAAEMVPYVKRVNGLTLLFEGPFLEAYKALQSMIRHAVTQR